MDRKTRDLITVMLLIGVVVVSFVIARRNNVILKQNDTLTQENAQLKEENNQLRQHVERMFYLEGE